MPAKRKPIKPGSDELVTMSLRLPAAIAAALDERVEAINAGPQWPKLTRTDLIRNVLAEATAAWESKPAKGSK